MATEIAAQHSPRAVSDFKARIGLCQVHVAGEYIGYLYSQYRFHQLLLPHRKLKLFPSGKTSVAVGTGSMNAISNCMATPFGIAGGTRMKQADYDYEEMARLYKENPTLFARRREEMIQSHIANSRRPEDLSELQMDLDALRYSVQPGVNSSEKLMGLLIEYSSDLSHQLVQLRELLDISSQPESRTGALGKESVPHG